MRLKRVFDRSGAVPKFVGVNVLTAGPRQNFSERVFNRGIAEGWLAVSKGRITVTAKNGDVVYRVVRGPGYYCCHDGAPMSDGKAAQKYIAEKFNGVRSPDPSNPSGYERLNWFECVKE